MPETSLKGRVALVTGVSRRKGIGFAIAQRLGVLGVNVFIHSFAPYDALQAWGPQPSENHESTKEGKHEKGTRTASSLFVLSKFRAVVILSQILASYDEIER